MSCSKLFSGDLPELLCKIIKYFQNDYSTLHSCVLVNRLWCRLAIPLLWENPFSIPTENYNFIEVYLYYLNDHLKTKLNEYQIIDHVLLPSNTLFNYPSFIRYLNINNIVPSIERWIESNDKTSKFSNAYFDQILNTVSEFKRLINISIFKIFIEHEVKLHTLEIEISSAKYNTYAENILEIILQNPKFIHNVRNLKFSILSSINNTQVKNRISQLINLQKNLKKISFGSNSLPLYQSLLSKESNCSNTLNTIIFYYVNFKSIINLDKVFEQLNVLESVHLIYCSSLNTGFTQQIINLTKPFKLKSLFICEISQIESLQLLLQKSGNYLENFGYGFGTNDQSLKRQLLELIIKYCKNIRFLDLDMVITSLMISLIENVKQNLNRLTVSVGNNYQDSNSRSILQNLGQILPPRLDYLCMSLYDIKASDFEVFIKNSQVTFFKKLLIDSIEQDSEGIDIVFYIKKYIMPNKRVKYLAIKNTFPSSWFGEMDLSSSIDEVKEFKLHNIKVLSYISLFTDINRFVNEID